MKSTAAALVEKLRTVFRGRVITVNVETVRLPNGHVDDLEIIHHPGGAAVVAIDDEQRVCLLRQYRHAIGGWIWELPAGKLEPAEPPLDTARRELIEEAGAAAEDWVSLGDYVSFARCFYRNCETCSWPAGCARSPWRTRRAN